jgi:hypothetical protein
MKTGVKRSYWKDHVASSPIRFADHRASPHDVLEEIDSLLAPFGLEIWTFDQDSDEYEFAIAPRNDQRPA